MALFSPKESRMNAVNACSISLMTGLALGAISPAVASSSVYGGSTSDRAPIVITLAKSGKLKTLGIDWTARCNSGSEFPFGGVLAAVAKRPAVISPGANPMFGSVKRGRLNATAFGSAPLGEDMSAAITQKVRGKVKRSSASGTWSARVDILDPEGNMVDHCQTGAVRWAARRGPTVYGGSTTQGEPVVVETIKSRTQIKYFGFGWNASCAPDGYATYVESLGNFPLTSGGAFGDQWTNDYPFQDGTGKSSFSYNLNGTLRNRRGSGTVSVDLTETDVSGATTSSCHTNRVAWSVSQ
jgi:hypothetical protein